MTVVKKRILTAVLPILLVGVLSFLLIFDFFGRDYVLTEKSTVAMGTVVTVRLCGSQEQLQNVVSAVNDLDARISRYREDSVVSEFNRAGASQDADVSALIQECGRVSEASDGAFDVTIGGVTLLWDFNGRPHVPDPEALRQALADTDYRSLYTDGDRIFCTGKRQIDLGAIGKGAACDAVRDYLLQTDVPGAVVSVGGSVLAYGARNRFGDPWRVAIRDPENEDGYLGVLLLKDAFVSTSGDYELAFTEDGTRYHHILDARTGYPADSGLSSVTVVCGEGALSDALSTACFILGKTDGETLIRKFGASAVFAEKDGTVTVIGDLDFVRQVEP